MALIGLQPGVHDFFHPKFCSPKLFASSFFPRKNPPLKFFPENFSPKFFYQKIISPKFFSTKLLSSKIFPPKNSMKKLFPRIFFTQIFALPKLPPP